MKENIIGKYITNLVSILNKNDGSLINVNTISTGFSDLDSRLIGLYNSDLILLTSLPAMGKTAFATNMARNLALKKNLPVLYYSIDHNANYIAQKIIAAELDIQLIKLQRSQIDSSERKNLSQKLDKLKHSPLYIEDKIFMPDEFKTIVKEYVNKNDVRIIFIDDLTIFAKDVLNTNIQNASKVLKEISLEFQIPIVVLHSSIINGQEDFTANYPNLEEFESNCFSVQKFDVVFFLNKPSYFGLDSNPNDLVELIVAKNRNGILFTHNFSYNNIKFIELKGENIYSYNKDDNSK